MPSTSIRKSEYDPESKVLSVWFVASGKRYDYEGVPAEVYAAFRSAFVKGRFSMSTFGTVSAIVWSQTISEVRVRRHLCARFGVCRASRLRFRGAFVP